MATPEPGTPGKAAVYFCAGCGETGRHAPDCPGQVKKRTADEEIRAADRFVLLDRIDATAAELAALRERVEFLWGRANNLLICIEERDRRIDALEKGLLALEARHTPKGPPQGKPVPDQPAKRAGGKK